MGQGPSGKARLACTQLEHRYSQNQVPAYAQYLGVVKCHVSVSPQTCLRLSEGNTRRVDWKKDIRHDQHQTLEKLAEHHVGLLTLFCDQSKDTCRQLERMRQPVRWTGGRQWS
jgi:hypothetical protein